MGKTYKIAVIPGDGTGPEVVNEGIKVLNTAASKFGFKLDYTNFDFGGERYLRTGETLPDSAINDLKKFDSIYLGAIGHPDIKPGILEVGILLKMRFALDQYINLRPVKLYPGVDTPLKDKGPEDIDFVVIRENTGGIYTGVGGAVQAVRKISPDDVAGEVEKHLREAVGGKLSDVAEDDGEHDRRQQWLDDEPERAEDGLLVLRHKIPPDEERDQIAVAPKVLQMQVEPFGPGLDD